MADNTRFRWSKWILSLVVLVLAGGGGVWYFKANHDTPIEYQTATVTRGNLTQVVTATGQLGPVVNVQVGSQISGIVKELFVDFNSVVKSNQVIARIDPSTYQLGVMKAEAQVAESKANQTLAKVQASRAESLFTNSLISSSDHDTAAAQLQQADAQVQIDESTLKNAQVQLSYCTIYAPVDGVVISRNVDVGQTVAASFNTPTVFVIANDLSKMQIDALVSEADIGGVAVGQDVNFTVDAYPYRTFHGRVNQVRYGAVTNQNVVTYDSVISVSNADLKLLPSMTANVQIITAQRNDTLKVPNAALRFHPPETLGADSHTNATAQTQAQAPRREGDAGGRGGQGGQGGGRRGESGESGSGAGVRPRADRPVTRTVYVLPSASDSKDPENAKPKPVQIKVGISDGIATEVLDGLEEGAQVVIGAITSADTSSRSSSPANNPFGGGMRRF